MPDRQIKSRTYFDASGLPLAIVRGNPQSTIATHSHEFTELVLVLSGQGTHVVARDRYPIGGGDVFVIMRGEGHAYRNTRDLRLVNILFDLDRLRVPLADLQSLPGYHVLFTLEPRYRRAHRFTSHLRLGEEELSHAAALITRIEGELAAKAPGYRFAATAVFMDMIGGLCRAYSKAGQPIARSLLRIGEAIGYLENHYAEPVSVARLARIAHLSERSLLREFRRAVGRSPIQHLIRLRIAKAADLLRAGGLNVTQAAFAVGFADSNYFTRQFRRITGRSPRQLRSARPDAGS